MASGQTKHIDQVTLGLFQARRNRNFVLLLWLCVPDERIGTYFNRIKDLIRVCQNRSDLIPKHYVTFSQYFIDMSNDEFKFHIELKFYKNLIGKSLGLNRINCFIMRSIVANILLLPIRLHFLLIDPLVYEYFRSF